MAEVLSTDQVPKDILDQLRESPQKPKDRLKHALNFGKKAVEGPGVSAVSLDKETSTDGMALAERLRKKGKGGGSAEISPSVADEQRQKREAEAARLAQEARARGSVKILSDAEQAKAQKVFAQILKTPGPADATLQETALEGAKQRGLEVDPNNFVRIGRINAGYDPTILRLDTVKAGFDKDGPSHGFDLVEGELVVKDEGKGKRIQYEFGGCTTQGPDRENNEDILAASRFWIPFPQPGGSWALNFSIEDGMGGHGAGEVASKVASDFGQWYLSRLSDAQNPEWQQVLAYSKELQNMWLQQRGNLNESDAIGIAIATTLVRVENKAVLDQSPRGSGASRAGTIIIGDKIYGSNYGDSRVEVFDGDGTCKSITKDHSLVRYLVDSGAITPEQAATHPQKNVIMRSLGERDSKKDIDPLKDVFIADFKLGYTVAVHCDGINGGLGDVAGEKIGKMVCSGQVGKAAYDVARKAGEASRDNDSIWVVRRTR